VNTMRDLPAARKGTFPGISSRLPTWRPSRSGNRCPQRRRPQLFRCRDVRTICAPFLHHEMQFQKLCSRRAPKGDDKIRQNTTKSDKTRHDLVPMTFRSKTNPLVVPALAGSAVLDAGRLQTGKTLPGNLNSGSFNPNTEVSSTRGSGESRDSDPCAVHGSGENRPVLPFLTPSFSASSACSCSSVSEFGLNRILKDAELEVEDLAVWFGAAVSLCLGFVASPR